MPLEQTDVLCQRLDLDGIGFPMKLPSGGTIGVVVGDEILQDMQPPAPVTDEDLIERCETYRSRFESIASNKYDAGQTTGPIRINSGDLRS